MKETVLQNFVINKMTQEQYDEALKSGTVKDDELYLTDLVASGGGSVQIFDASEDVKGVAKIATSSEAKQGYNDNTIMTPLKTKQVIGDNIGRLNQLGYIGTLAGGVLTFEQPSDETPYELKVGYEYLVDLLFEAVGEISDDVQIVIKNGGNYINLVNVLHDDTVNPMTIGDIKQVMKYSIDLGWRWLFKAWYTETQAGAKVLVMPSTVVSSEFSDTIKKTWGNTLNGLLQNWQSTALSLETSDGTVASILEKRSISDNSTSNIIRQYSIADMTKFAGIENSVTDDGKGRLSYEVNGENTNLTEYSADSSNTDIALKGWVLKNSTNLQITNCITEIPQDIKLELVDGVLTLKAGSKVYVPNGAGVFDETTIAGDLTIMIGTGTHTKPIVIKGSRTFSVDKTAVFSGSTAPTSFGQYAIWYDTTNNLVKTTADGGSTWESGWSLPIGIATVTSNVITNIDQVFNGFGYIGSTVFALPRVKGLVPNGRNEDGSLKNDVFEIKSVQVVPHTSDNKYYIILGNSDPRGYSPNRLDTNFWVRENNSSDPYGYKYDDDRNIFVGIGSENLNNQIYMTIVGYFEVSGGRITSFTKNNLFQAIDRNDLDILAGNIVTTTGISKSQNGYIKLGNGIIIQWGQMSASSTQITFPTAFSNTNYQFVDCVSISRDSNDLTFHPIIYNNHKTTTGIIVKVGQYGSNATTRSEYTHNWLAIGY